MKNAKKYSSLMILFLIAIFCVSCKEYTTKTKINEDGSCERIVIVEGDKSNINELPFPVPTDKSWQIERRKSEKDKDKIVYTAKKQFGNVNSLNNEYRKNDKIGVEIKFEKKFRWFYTYYSYEEKYKSYFPYKMITLKSFLTEKEYQLFLDGDTTKALKSRLEKYAAENYLEYFLGELVKECKRKGIKEVNEKSAQQNKAAIMEDIDKYDKDFDALLNSMSARFGSPSLKSFAPLVEKVVNEVGKKMEWVGSASGTYINQVTMPGIILSTNSKSVKGNTVEWKMNDERFLYDDLVMKVESRSANVVAFIGTGLIILLALLMLMMPKLRRKTN